MRTIGEPTKEENNEYENTEEVNNMYDEEYYERAWTCSECNSTIKTGYENDDYGAGFAYDYVASGRGCRKCHPHNQILHIAAHVSSEPASMIKREVLEYVEYHYGEVVAYEGEVNQSYIKDYHDVIDKRLQICAGLACACFNYYFRLDMPLAESNHRSQEQLERNWERAEQEELAEEWGYITEEE